jgi:YD repeat-containing protein
MSKGLSPFKSYWYVYDAVGNRVEVIDDGVVTGYTTNDMNQYTDVGVTTPTDTWIYTYDGLGNRIASTHNGVTTNYVINPIGLGNVAAEYEISTVEQNSFNLDI